MQPQPPATWPSSLGLPGESVVTKATLAALARVLRSWHRTAVAALAAFFRTGGTSQAAALAFFALLSCIPMIFCILALYGAVAGDSWAAQLLVRSQLRAAAPFLDEVLVSKARRLLWASPGLTVESLAFIFWSSWLFIGALRRALALPWREADPPPPTWPARLRRLAWAPVAGALFLAAVTLVLAGAHLPRLEPPGSLLRRLATPWGLLCLTGLYGAVYLLFLPGRRPIRALCGLSAALAVAAYGVGALFVAVLADPARYHLVYGSFGNVILFLLWLDYQASLVLWGAWFLRIWQRDHPVAVGHRRFALLGRGKKGDTVRRACPPPRDDPEGS
jgi:membrane protein